MKNITIALFVLLFSTGTMAQRALTYKIDDYKRLVGKWYGSGFVTDASGIRQDVNATQWVNIKIIDGIKTVETKGHVDNVATGFNADFLKQFYYSNTLSDWRIKVYMENKYYLTTKLSLSDNYTLIYTFKDEKGAMNRATIYAANPFGWTEMLETWNGNGWDIKRRLFMRKEENLPKHTYSPPY
jgi:hypothetical protein